MIYNRHEYERVSTLTMWANNECNVSERESDRSTAPDII